MRDKRRLNKKPHAWVCALGGELGFRWVTLSSLHPFLSQSAIKSEHLKGKSAKFPAVEDSGANFLCHEKGKKKNKAKTKAEKLDLKGETSLEPWRSYSKKPYNPSADPSQCWSLWRCRGGKKQKWIFTRRTHVLLHREEEEAEAQMGCEE